MFVYVILEALVGIIAGLVLAIRTKKDASVSYGSLDRFGKFTNILLLVVYVCASPLYMFIGMICAPAQDGVLGILGWIISIVCASAAFFCFLGLGLSVMWRKQGKSGKSFAVQFMGVISIALTVALYLIFEGTLLQTLN